MGLGYPDEFDAGDSEVSVLIGNAYNQDLYAAKIAAGLEALTGKGSRIEWRNRERKSGSYVLTAD
jgi:hypothetical protein